MLCVSGFELYSRWMRLQRGPDCWKNMMSVKFENTKELSNNSQV